jgi:hypothetical protein
MKKPQQQTRKPSSKARTVKPVRKETLVHKSRTLNEVERALRLSTRPMPQAQKDADMWTACRLAPWNNQHGALIPDGTNDPRIAVDLYAYTDISVDKVTSFNLATLPSLPYAAFIQPKLAGAKYTLTGSNTVPPNSTGGGFYTSFTSGTPNNCATPINFTKAAGQVTYADNPNLPTKSMYITADKARITSMGWRLVYTGPASTCQGTVTVHANPLRNDDVFPKTVGTIQYYQADMTAANTQDTSAIPVKAYPFTNITLSNAYGKESIMARPEATLHGLCRRSQRVYNWKEISEQPYLLINTDTANNEINGPANATMTSTWLVGGSYGTVGTAKFGTVSLMDDDWDSTLIQLDNVQGSFRFETWQCIEFIPVVESLAFDMARKLTTTNEAAIARANQLATMTPLASVSTKNGSPA